MMIGTLTMTDAREREAIERARGAHKAMLTDGAGLWPVDPAGSCADDETYIRKVAALAVESWAVQHVDQ